MYKSLLSVFCFLFLAQYALLGQYTINGSATQDNCHCYTLTPAQLTQSGSVWNNNRIDLSQSFAFTFDVNLGCNDANGADGIAFVLQPVSTSIGSQGSGLGYQGITPAVGVTLDTWQNTDEGDPTFDHIAIQLNGTLNHNSPNNIAGPVTMLASGGNAEDCNWHTLRVVWDAVAKRYDVYFDGNLRLTLVKDFVADVFSGNPMVFWGFTGSTGGSLNLQRFCTSLTPRFRSLSRQKRCVNEPITFYDSTSSFGPIVKRYWDFGDGSNIDSVNIDPVHTYTVAGDYTVTLRVKGTDGCIEVFSQVVRVGSKPVAYFKLTGACADSLIGLVDSSYATVGTINSWYWDLGSSGTSILQNPTVTYNTPGPKTIRLAVQSEEGCLSDTTDKVVDVYPNPTAAFSLTNNICAGTASAMTDLSPVPAPNQITGWNWTFGGNGSSAVQNPAPVFTAAGNYPISLQVQTDRGCRSTIVQQQLTVIAKPVAYFRDTTICESTAVTLKDSSYSPDGTPVNGWWWSFGNSQTSTQQNPVVTYPAGTPITVALVATNANSCVSDTFKRTLVIHEKPIAKIGYDQPLCTNKPHQFRDSSTVNGDVINDWLWLFDNNNTGNLKDPVQSFNPGGHLVKLVVRSNAGCQSDTAFRNYITNPKPDITSTVRDGCVNQAIPFTATTGSTITAWVWNYGDGVTGSTQNTQYTYAITGEYTVSLFGIANTGCYSDTLRKKIVIYGTQAFAGNDVVAAMGQPVQLTGSGGISYQWSPPDGLSDPNIANPIATNTVDRTYTLRASTPQGCSSTDQVSIKVYKGPDVYVPNAFSPNGDGRNDILRALPVGISRFDYFTVFNRYGEKVFYTSNAAYGWNGFFQNKQQPQGAYTWMVSAVDYTGKPIFKKGMVILIR